VTTDHLSQGMRWRRWFSIVSIFACLLAVPVAPGANANQKRDATSAPPAWNIVWSDEFNGADNSAPDPAKWVLETGGNGWGNNELEYYTARPDNARIQNGSLVITAIDERYTGPDGVTRDYTSARLKTQGTFALAYGKFEARIRVPQGQGIWPAFWMLGNDITALGWPRCGEIDIMEHIGREPSTVHGTIHGPRYSGAKAIGAAHNLPGGQRFADAFHLFAVEWEPNVIRWYVDDVLFATKTPADLPKDAKWVYDHPFFLLLNVAVGGNWPGSPDRTTVFPQTMLVDYVRVYKRGSATLESAMPSSGTRAATLDVTLSGTEFADGATVSFGERIKVLSVDVAAATEIAVRIKIKKRATVGPRDVVVTNPDGTSATAVSAFRIR
jgi:beta-glucanase (GH16 family)